MSTNLGQYNQGEAPAALKLHATAISFDDFRSRQCRLNIYIITITFFTAANMQCISSSEKSQTTSYQYLPLQALPWAPIRQNPIGCELEHTLGKSRGTYYSSRNSRRCIHPHDTQSTTATTRPTQESGKHKLNGQESW